MANIQEPIRFATFNASLNRNSEGQLIEDLSTQNNSQAQNVAEIIQRTNPDVVLINEFDYDPDGTAAQLFRENYLSVSQNGVTLVNYPYKYVADAAVFWPTTTDSLYRLVGDRQNADTTPSSDHSLVWADLEVEPTVPDVSKKTVADIEFLGDATFETGFTFNETEVGGLSDITYDPFKNVFYSISDDRSQNYPARFYTLSIDVSDSDLQDNDVTFQNVTTPLNENGEPFPELSLDPEGIVLTNKSTLLISSEGDASNLTNPFVNQFSLQGRQFQELPVPEKFLPSSEGTRGIRNNLAFESLTITPNNQYLFTATENALIQDGPAADLENGSPARIIKNLGLKPRPSRTALLKSL